LKFHSFTDELTLNQNFATQIVTKLTDAIQARGHAYLVVSGGKTPLPLFKLLAQTTLPWEQVTICLADERCVSADDAARNERMLRNNLLQLKAKTANFISLYDELQPTKTLQNLEQTLLALPQFDVVILGMGEDGHTASLFPCSEELATGLSDNAPAVLIVNPKTAPHQRISLSKNRLLNTRSVYIHLTGNNKRVILEQARLINDPMQMPICAFLNHEASDLQVMYAP